MARQFDLVLGDHFDRFIDEQIASGRYESASEVIMAGLRLLEDQERENAWFRDQVVRARAVRRDGTEETREASQAPIARS